MKISKDNVIMKHEEYTVPFDVASKMDIFKCTWCIPYDDCKKDLDLYLNTKDLDYIGWDYPTCTIEFGCLDIEFMYYGDDGYGKPDCGFFLCYKTNNSEDNWEELGFTDLIFTADLMDSKEKFEKAMYDSMIRTAKNNNLLWSKINTTNN